MSEREKCALVTGASSGLGAALTDRLLARGYRVVTVDHRAPPGSPDRQRLQVTCDLADRTALDRTLPVLLDAGPYDVVLLNAGISATGRFEAMPPAVLERVVRVDAEAPMVMAAALLQAESLAPGARLGFVSSLSHFTGYPGAAAYAAAKDALAVYARSIRKAASRRGVTVSTIFPGPLDTAMARRHAPADASAEKRLPPSQAARLVLEGLEKRRRVIVPGRVPLVYAGLGRLFPGAATALMRRLVFEKLDRETW
ncbi:short-chain dehydrogenase [Zhengella mangrovi]|uniref:Short-chain dehydrogenase n=1 Tax=Zhengella mangrovi TaxID=1982044 RepID=A0A2G1QL20_9HYPH|nr:SDR family NAD(P)-dependent oxidoreductase [Zhengella mangrovi]PHP66216.1 short-chain dehydrogenase [Zhengella mangrovi]